MPVPTGQAFQLTVTTQGRFVNPREFAGIIVRATDDGRLVRVQDVARVPFACRSLAFDGRAFWTNHRAQNETVAFSLP